MGFVLDAGHRRRVIISLIAEEIGRLRQRDLAPAESLAWVDETPLGQEPGTGGAAPLGLDSLGRIDVASRLNQFFHLHEVGIEDYLLIEKTIGRWCAIIAEAERHGGLTRVTFQTSGSTGAPKTCTHQMDDIADEARELVDVLQQPSRIISLVPPHHIYGFIFTAALPQVRDCPVIDARSFSPGRLMKELEPGDLVVATPHLWRYLATSLPAFPGGVSGVASTAPMPAELSAELLAKGLVRLTEVYGSSETAGIGWRQDTAQPFRLFDAWDVTDDQSALRRRSDGDPREAIPFGDHVTFSGPRLLRPTGRRDGAVQVGGLNVFPDLIRQKLESHDGVSVAAVRVFAVGGDAARQRLKAFVVPVDPAVDLVALEAELRRYAAVELRDVERPVGYTFGVALPVNAMGKLTNWS
jgi:long-chain acyl-CoA synthetase